jgi:Ca2+-binding EF-hand superfamily protein
MASKHAQSFAIPEGTSGVLTELTKEVLRVSTYSEDINSAEDLHAFCYSYFMEQLERRESEAYDGEGEVPERMSNDDLIVKVGQLFDQADQDGNGFLDRKEFKQVFVSLKEELGLSNKVIKQIMAEADENDDGVIEYREFVPMAVDVINIIEAKQDFKENQEMDKMDAVEDAKDFLLHGMPRDTLEEMLKSAFIKADKDKSGYLDRKEFKQCLKASGLGFTKKEINVMMSEVDLDGDGKITYDEFVPLCFSMLADMMADKMKAMTSETEEEIKSTLEEIFMGAFGEGPYVNKSEATALLREADLGLTRVQIAAVMSEVNIDKKDTLDYHELTTVAAGVVAALLNVERQRVLADQMSDLKAQEDYGTVLGLTQDQMSSSLDANFRELDVDGAGLLTIDQVAQVVLATLELSPRNSRPS